MLYDAIKTSKTHLEGHYKNIVFYSNKKAKLLLGKHIYGIYKSILSYKLPVDNLYQLM